MTRVEANCLLHGKVNAKLTSVIEKVLDADGAENVVVMVEAHCPLCNAMLKYGVGNVEIVGYKRLGE